MTPRRALRAAAAARALPAPLAGLGLRRRVGRWGTLARLTVGSTLVVLALSIWEADWLEVLIGLVALPTVATLLMSLRRRSASPLRLGAAGHLITGAHVAVTVSIVPEAAALFYGSMALVAGLQGNGGCEITAISNWLRGRDDQVGCPFFAPFDAVDAHASADRDRHLNTGAR
jgi:hypothetical protein